MEGARNMTRTEGRGETRALSSPPPPPSRKLNGEGRRCDLALDKSTGRQEVQQWREKHRRTWTIKLCFCECDKPVPLVRRYTRTTGPEVFRGMRMHRARVLCVGNPFLSHDLCLVVGKTINPEPFAVNFRCGPSESR